MAEDVFIIECIGFFIDTYPHHISMFVMPYCLLMHIKVPQLEVTMLPERGWFLQDTSHNVHLGAAVAEPSEKI